MECIRSILRRVMECVRYKGKPGTHPRILGTLEPGREDYKFHIDMCAPWPAPTPSVR